MMASNSSSPQRLRNGFLHITVIRPTPYEGSHHEWSNGNQLLIRDCQSFTESAAVVEHLQQHLAGFDGIDGVRQTGAQVDDAAGRKLDFTAFAADAQLAFQHLDDHGHGRGVLAQCLVPVEAEQHGAQAVLAQHRTGDSGLLLNIDQRGQVFDESKMRLGRNGMAFGVVGVVLAGAVLGLTRFSGRDFAMLAVALLLRARLRGRALGVLVLAGAVVFAVGGSRLGCRGGFPTLLALAMLLVASCLACGLLLVLIGHDVLLFVARTSHTRHRFYLFPIIRPSWAGTPLLRFGLAHLIFDGFVQVVRLQAEFVNRVGAAGAQ